MHFKNQWDMEMVLQVLTSETVDSQTWSDAVKWLMLFGPPQIKQVLLQASASATSRFFPQLKPAGFNDDGEPYYEVANLAEALVADPEALLRSLTDLEGESGSCLSAEEEDIFKIQ